MGASECQYDYCLLDLASGSILEKDVVGPREARIKNQDLAASGFAIKWVTLSEALYWRTPRASRGVLARENGAKWNGE